MPAERVAFCSDDHAPYINWDTVNCRLAVIRRYRPHVLILGGDHLDCYQLSKFDKTPDRIDELQSDMDACYRLLRKYRRAAGDTCKIIYLEGNHEERFKTHILRNAPALYGLRALTIPRLLSLDDLGIEWVDGGVWDYKGFVYKHGNAVRNRSGYSATGEMDRFWESGMSGHTHRLGVIYKTVFRREVCWVEAGCGCEILDYIKGGPADWQSGMALNEYDQDRKLWNATPVKITKGACRIEGEEVTA